MADDSSSEQTKRKVRYPPKIPSRDKPKAAKPKIEVHPNAEAAKTCAPSDGLTSKASDTNKNKALADPWDISSNYPVTLPLRGPNSDEPEFNEDVENAADLKLDETKINAAKELGLMEESEEPRIFRFQLPFLLPVVEKSANAKGKEIVDDLKPSTNMGTPEKGCSLEELPPGFMCKMLVYKSGAIKMKIGEILYDVNPALGDSCSQIVTAIDTQEKNYCDIGQVNKYATVTPNIDSLLDNSKKSGD